MGALYTVRVKDSAERELRKLPKRDNQRVIQRCRTADHSLAGFGP